MKRKDKRRRIKGLTVNEVSLVDNPAVPAARFVLAKRKGELEDVEKGATQEETAAMAGLRECLGTLDELAMTLPADVADMVDEFAAAARDAMRGMRQEDDDEPVADDGPDLAEVEAAAARALASGNVS